MSFLDILVKRKLIGENDVSPIVEESKNSGLSLDEVLNRRGIAEADILTAKGEYMQIPTRDLSEVEIPYDILKYIPEESAMHYEIIPLDLKDGVLEVGIVNPDNIEARDALNFISSKLNMPFKFFLISETDFSRIAETYKGLSGQVTKALSEFETEMSDEEKEIEREKKEEKAAAEAGPGQGPQVVGDIVEDAPVTKIVATILRYAIEGGASDVHIEHMKDKVRVRFRVDGVLNTSLILPVKVHPAVVARIKVLSNMKLDEKRKPQDGRFSAHIDGRKIDFRISTFPAYYGEKIVMRILDEERGVKDIDQIGITPENLKLIMDAIDRPYGMILISGPTGSGKTTTLYSMLKEVDKEEMNVLSLEDPVEYNIDGMSQSQVRPEIGYTFASGLRTTLRQDPDIIMVGEIRDKETAQLAVQAALTGHLVFSTIHTNDSIGIIPRLIDMGVDPYLIAPTLILGMAQRLVGTIPPSGGTPLPVDGSLKIMFDKEFEDLPEEYRNKIAFPKEVLGIKPTPEYPKGTHGRAAVFEAFKMDRELEAVILKEPTDIAIRKYLRNKGMLTLKEDAILKVFRGEVPVEEINKL
ncbi:MAG: ATPase, T2SS/T4P/T4SS family [bacterium]